MAVVAIVNPAFFSGSNIIDLLRTATFSFVVAVPITFLMSSGGMDLSIGALTSFGGVICGMAMRAGMPIGFSILLALLGGMLVGFINGVIIVRFEMPAFITTLGTQYAVNGLIAIITQNVPISGFSPTFKNIGQYRIGGILPIVVIYALIIGVVGHFLLKRAKFGRSILAIGGNRETAYLAGIKVNALRISVFVATSALAALCGVLYTARFATAQPDAGTGTELTIMASVIIGGTSMYGGSGTVIGSALGCFMFATIANALIIMGISTYWQNLIFGVILLVSIFIDKARRQASGGAQ